MIFQFKLCPKEFNRRLGPESKVALSDNSNFIAFSDIDNSLLLYNKSRNTLDHLAKRSRFFKTITFCGDLVVAAEDGSSEVLIFSTKSNLTII